MDHVQMLNEENPSHIQTMERLLLVVQELSAARDLETVMDIVRRSARVLTGSDGATFVLQENGACYYAEEDAISPLWKGKRFPMETCVSGWVMQHRQPAIIDDIFTDMRVPIDVYRKTFVKSLAIVPIKTTAPIGAIGCYWAGPHAASAEEIKVLQVLADTTAISMESIHYQQVIATKAEQMEKAIEDTLMAIARMVEQKDPYTAGHQQRVAHLGHAIAGEMGWPQKCQESVFRSGVVHDIGKIGIPSELLSKPAKLTPYEFALIQTHSEAGYEILKDIHLLRTTADIILQHHERYNGSGYPNGLKGDQILPESHILAAADVFESMISHRPYRPALGVDAALDELVRNRAILYHPDVVDATVRLIRKKGYELPEENPE